MWDEPTRLDGSVITRTEQAMKAYGDTEEKTARTGEVTWIDGAQRCDIRFYLCPQGKS